MKLRLTGLPALTALHGLSSGLNLVFSLLQTIVFARVISSSHFASAVFLVSVGLYLLPFHQIIARANFALFLEQTDQQSDGPRNDAALLFQIGIFAAIAVSFLAPFISARSASDYAALACLSLYINLSNPWVNELQTSYFMRGNGLKFASISLVRRIIGLAALLCLYFSYLNFNSFCYALAILAIVFHYLALAESDLGTALPVLPNGADWPRLRRQFVRAGTAAQIIGAEWLTLTMPYPVFTALYGVGTSLVALDTGLKLVRVTLTVSRVLSEASITKMTQALSSLEPRSARRVTKVLLAVSAAFAVPFALLVLLDDRMIFSFLLGSNFAIPAGLGQPIAIAILGSVFFQISIYFIGHFGDSSEMRETFVVSLVMSAMFAVCVLIARPSLPTAIWIFVSTFVVVGIAATLVFRRLLSSVGTRRRHDARLAHNQIEPADSGESNVSLVSKD